MALRKLLFKMIAVILVLTFVTPGVALANTVCSGTCDCCKQEKSEVSCHVTPSVLSPSQAHGDIPKVLGHGSHYDPFAGLFNSATICSEEIGSTPCEMTAAGDLEDVKGPAPTVRVGERSLATSPALITSKTFQGNQLFFGIILRELIPSKFTTVPLYLRNFSIIC